MQALGRKRLTLQIRSRIVKRADSIQTAQRLVYVHNVASECLQAAQLFMLHVIKKLVQLRTIKKGTRSYIGPRAGRPCASDCVDLSSGVEWSGVDGVCLCMEMWYSSLGACRRVLEKLLVPQLVKKFHSFWVLNVYHRVYKSPLYVSVLSQIYLVYSLFLFTRWCKYDRDKL